MSLPKKGDRVRILGCGKGATQMWIGQTYVLYSDAAQATTPGKVIFCYVSGSGRINSSGAVAVEVVRPESPSIQSAREGLAKLEEMTGASARTKCPACDGHGGDGGQSETSGTWEFPCELCFGMSRISAEAMRAYQAGLRRAQELAKEHVYATEDEVFEPGRGHVRALDWEDYDQAIDAEAAKERT